MLVYTVVLFKASPSHFSVKCNAHGILNVEELWLELQNWQFHSRNPFIWKSITLVAKDLHLFQVHLLSEKTNKHKQSSLLYSCDSVIRPHEKNHTKKKPEQTLMALCCHKVFYEGATFVPHHKTVNCVNWTGPAVSPPQPAGLRSVKSSVI